ncbi:hypothetical protein [Terracoccus luteus]|uniref:Uncharacterized protein n=2 Tax=Terracoccus luteus TaxID=53356 RepID=A0A839PPH1_9MICO|nr:hypothetical protein [Terracoccus luteus]MBB2985417.1 hypothetical protein [Terracoccus luteus]MCP2171069.1 hypothetical protein [Terracoccus luteus]
MPADRADRRVEGRPSVRGDGRDGVADAGGPGRRHLRALARAWSQALAMGDELLAHTPDVGEEAVQHELDLWVEQAADTLHALGRLYEDRLLEATPPPVEGPRRPDDDEPPPPPSRRRETSW